MNDEILWVYTGDGVYIDGVPARDLTAADWEALDAFQRAAVEHMGLYRQKWARARARAVEKPEAAESPEEPVEKAAEDGPRKGKRGQDKE